MDPIISLEGFSISNEAHFRRCCTTGTPVAYPNLKRIADAARGLDNANDGEDWSPSRVFPREIVRYASSLFADTRDRKQTANDVSEDRAKPTRVNVDCVASHNAQALQSFRQTNSEDASCPLDIEELDDTNAFLIFDLLSPEQCEHIRATAEPFLAPLDHLYEQRTRMADRALIRSSVIAQELFSKILPLLDRERDYAERTPLCFGHDGVWVPIGLNECLKVFRYNRGGEFVPHRDGPWVPRQDQCSMYTLVVYLNDNFVGGTTLLAGTCEFCEPGGRRSTNWETEPAMMHIAPVCGMGLLLNHDCWHAGRRIIEGTKWILRTELIFQRVHSFYVDKEAFASDENYIEARALYHKSMTAAASGDRATFFESYQRVIQMQCDAMQKERSIRKRRILNSLGPEELSLVLSFVPLRSLRDILRLNRNSYAAVSRAPFWQDKLRELAVSGSEGCVEQSVVSALIESERAKLACSCRHVPTTTSTDYFSAFRRTVLSRKHFVPSTLVLTDSGAILIISRRRVYRKGFQRRFREAYRPEFVQCAPHDAFKTEHTLTKMCRYYTCWRYRSPVHMNQPLGESMQVTDEDHGLPENGGKEVIARADGKVEWSVVTCAIESAVETADSPLLIVSHPAWPGHTAPRQEALGALFELSSIPAIAFLHPAICAVLGAKALGFLRNETVTCAVELRYGFTLIDGFSVGCSFPDDVTCYWFDVNLRDNTVVALGSATVDQISSPEDVPQSDLVCIDCDPRASDGGYSELEDLRSECKGSSAVFLPLAETIAAASGLLLSNPIVSQLFLFAP